MHTTHTRSLRPTWNTAYHMKYLWKHSKQQNSQKSGKIHICTVHVNSTYCAYIHTSIRDVVCVGVFDLPSQLMMGVATLLLGAAAIDRQNKKVVHPISPSHHHTITVHTPSLYTHPHCTHTLQEGGVYNKLFAGLNSALDSQQRKSAATVAGR